MLKAEGNFELMGMTCKKLVFHPQKKLADSIYEVYLSDNIAKIPWHPYTFMAQVPSGFLGLYKSVAGALLEGIEVKEIKRPRVSVDFFRVSPTMKIERRITPLKLNR